jgi:hypothetical protein
MVEVNDIDVLAYEILGQPKIVSENEIFPVCGLKDGCVGEPKLGEGLLISQFLAGCVILVQVFEAMGEMLPKIVPQVLW